MFLEANKIILDDDEVLFSEVDKIFLVDGGEIFLDDDEFCLGS